MYLKNYTYIIAEAGVNHNGNFNLAKKLIFAAKKCGADAVKFQSFNPEDVVTKKLTLAKYQQKNLSLKKNNMLEMIKKLELTKKDQFKLLKISKKLRIDFISSAFDLDSLNFLIKKLKLSIIKIPSGEINNFPYLKKISEFNKKVILSTGMSNFKEIDQALKILTSKSLKKNKIIVLHCNTAYPTPYKDVNLKVLDEFKKRYKNRFGLSDHSLGIEVPIAAAALDAKVIEKHFTLNKKFKGPDHKSSLEPKEFSKMVNSIRNIDVAKGSKIKKVSMSEKQNIFFARKSIVAKIPIKKGQRFTDKNITVKRPGNGLSPMSWPKVIKKRAKVSFKKDEQIR
ncbi:MAG: N-acetylneuraminate synthase [Candidatus Pelagibacter sp.]|nr:N-acetylneuraminate synthase [Candidatus Pelagibacter sp.]OUW23363.1 MAG: N-acetylneuraminate synthase [Rickettsiales bacterium TMED174]